MSLTFPAALTRALKVAAVDLDWALLIYYYNGSNRTNAIGLSSVDRIIGTQQYYGVVSDWGEIANSLDLKTQTAVAGAFDIICKNSWKGGTFSDELFGGTNTYLNAKALLYMGESTDTTLANWQLLGEYRLTAVSCTQSDVSMSFEERTPWDKLSLPIEKQGAHYFPLVYGNFTTGSGPTYLDTAPWPCPIYNMNYDKVTCLLFTQATGTIGLYYYEPAIELFIPVAAGTAADSGSSHPNDDGKSAQSAGNLWRDFDFFTKGQSSDVDDSFTDSGGTREAILSDGNVLTYCYRHRSYTGSSSGYQYDYLCLALPQIEGYLEAFDVNICFQYYLDGLGGSNTYTWDLFDITYNGSATPDPTDATSVTITNGSHTADGGDVWSAEENQTYTLHSTNTYEANNSYPGTLKLCFRTSNTSGGNVNLRCRITDVKIQVQVKMTDENDNLSYNGAYYIETIKQLYSDEDGPANVWNAAAITECQQIHREILQTHVGLATDDIDTTSWGLLDTAKDGWSVRFWEMEPRPVKEILEQLQFEGGFIAFWSAQKVKYVWVKDSYSSADQTLTDGDYENLSINMTPLDDLMTYRTYRHNRHAAKDETTNSATAYEVFNANARTDWNIATYENKEEVDLQYLVACISGGVNPNSSVGNYYANILEDPKIIAGCTIKNYTKMNLEIGDIVKFNDPNILPFGKAWADLYFMVIETRRTKNVLDIVTQEVYEA